MNLNELAELRKKTAEIKQRENSQKSVRNMCQTPSLTHEKLQTLEPKPEKKVENDQKSVRSGYSKARYFHDFCKK